MTVHFEAGQDFLKVFIEINYVNKYTFEKKKKKEKGWRNWKGETTGRQVLATVL